MIILRDDARITRMKRLGQITSFLGMGILLAGLFLVFLPGTANLFFYQIVALFAGWMLSQIGIYLGNRYMREPRPDQVLDDVLKKVARDGRIYHYLLPAAHVLLIPTGIILFITKYQSGTISVEGDKWKQTGLGLRRFFGQERLGNPSREAALSVEAVASYLNKNAPSVEEVPIAAMIVFTGKGNNNLDLKNSAIPAMHFTKVKGYLRQQKGETPMPEEDFAAIKAAFDQKAAHLINEAELSATES
ncbi:MAG: NERD domain-containing protein [Ardenticatenaceae bacterium]|nr:NERD domain-containing protein [Ardenticatenaceae bacterium]MCB8947535.1 NERD domain-containing protein [Ardenticatenaceae bacterium]